jgi:hypothetical protein
MKNILLFIFLMLSTYAFSQTDKDERAEHKTELREKNGERYAKAKEKAEYNVFRRQMLVLKEYADERKKIPALQKATKAPAKVTVYVDSLSDAEENKVLIGYIREEAGDNAANVYEVTYDRAQKKIVSIRSTGETIDMDNEDAGEKKIKEKVIRKKSRDDDDDEDTDEEKPVKVKHKEKDKD